MRQSTKRGWYFSLLWTGFLLWSPWAYAQNDAKDVVKSNTLLQALRFLDSRQAEDQQWSLDALRTVASSSSDAASAHFALAIVQYNLERYQEVPTSLDQLQGQPSLHPEVRIQAGILRLLQSTVVDDKPTATKLFSSLSEASMRETVSISDRKQYASILGELCGLLEPVAAKSPIDSNLLSKTRGSLSHCGELAIEQAFKSAYSTASQRAQRLAAYSDDLAQLGLDELQKKLQAMEASLEEKRQTSAAQKESVDEAKDENNAATKQLRLEKKRMDQELSEIANDLKSVTQGHPGPAMRMPVRPDPNRVLVDEFETRVIIDSKGKPTTITQRKPSYEIDRERNARLQFLLVEYEQASAAYQNYQKRLAEWEKADRERKKELAERRLRIQETIRGLLAEIEKLEDANKDVAQEFREVRQEERKLLAEIEILRDFLKGASQGKPELAFRPIRLTPDWLTQQKNRLSKIASSARS